MGAHLLWSADGAITDDQVLHVVTSGQGWLSVFGAYRNDTYAWAPVASIPAFELGTDSHSDALEAELALH